MAIRKVISRSIEDSTIATADLANAAVTDAKIAAGSGGADGTHTGIPIRGDGSGGVVSVTVTSGAVTAVTVTTEGTGYTFGTISNAQIVAAGATSLTGAELDVIIPPKG